MNVNCFLKISYQHNHKKYRYARDKPINFHQIRKDFQLHLDKDLLYLIPAPAVSHDLTEGPSEIRLKEQGLAELIKKKEFANNQTIKIKIIEDTKSSVLDKSLVQNDNDSITIPEGLSKVRSKSQELNIETSYLDMKSNDIQITQQFYCNSNFEARIAESQLSIEWVRKEMDLNQSRTRQIEERKGFTNIPRLLNFMEDCCKEGKQVF